MRRVLVALWLWGCEAPGGVPADVPDVYRGDDVPSLRWTNPGADADLAVAIGSGILRESLPTDVTFVLQATPPNVACEGAVAAGAAVRFRP